MSKNTRVYSSASIGLLFWPSLRRILKAAGYSIRPKFLTHGRGVAVWGRVERSRKTISKNSGVGVLTFEDAFLRSVLPGQKTPPIGLTIDDIGVFFDSTKPSSLENLLQTKEVTPELLTRANDGRDFLRHYGLSKYNAVPRGSGEIPDAGFVLVVDQVEGDASVVGGQADAQTFSYMLAAALAENPDQRIVIRAHPATRLGKNGYLTGIDGNPNVIVLKKQANVWDLLGGAAKVYCVSSQLGFEAILAGHRPHVFGSPFYAGWGLSDDRQPIPRRTRRLTVDELFAITMIEFPFWFDRTRNTACSFEDAARQLLAESRHYWDGLIGSNFVGIRLWKRSTVKKFLSGGKRPIAFYQDEDAVLKTASSSRQIVVWANRQTDKLKTECDRSDMPLIRMEDGFLRSTGLGAELTPASSLVLDNAGIYYDPTHESQLENLLNQSVKLPNCAMVRAREIRDRIVETGVTKYNIDAVGTLPMVSENQKIILVPGQVADDASILKGAGEVNHNLSLLKATRASNPTAYIIYKPHPDVAVGLREGSIDATEYCDFVADNHGVNLLIDMCDEVWTMTSLLGFEALLREKTVTCFGMPFYAGWGLTNDVGVTCERRHATINLDQLVHATLVDYARYMDPISGIACTPELIIERLADRTTARRPALKALAKLQGLLSSYTSIWR